MAVYKGSVELISGITQKNGGTFALMDAASIQVDDTDKRLNQKLKELEEATNAASATIEWQEF